MKRKKQLLANARKNLSEKDYFESKSFRNYLTSMFKFMTRCKKKGVINLFGAEDGFTACTDGKRLMLNWKNPLTATFPTMKLRILSVVGMFFHEIGHMLYTDFNTATQYVEDVAKMGRFSVNVDFSLNKKKMEVEKFLQDRPAFREYISQLLFNIINIIEDVWMEGRLCEEFEGTVKNAIIINRSKISDTTPTLKKQIEAQYMDTCIVSNLLLVYASSGIIPNPHGLQTVHVDVLEQSKKYVNKGISSNNQWGRLIASTNIFLCMWDLVINEITQREQQAKQQMQDGQNQGSNGSEGESGTSNSQNGESGENEKNTSSRTPSELDKAIAEEMQKEQKEQTTESSNKNDEAKTSEHFRGERPNKQEAESNTNSNNSQKQSECSSNNEGSPEEQSTNSHSKQDKSKNSDENSTNSSSDEAKNTTSDENSSSKDEKCSSEQEILDHEMEQSSGSENSEKEESLDGENSSNAGDSGEEMQQSTLPDSQGSEEGEKTEGEKASEETSSETTNTGDSSNENETGDNGGEENETDDQTVNGETSDKQDTSEAQSETSEEGLEDVSQAISDMRELMQEMLSNSPRFAETEGELKDADQEGSISYEDFEKFSNDGIGEKIAKSLEEYAEEQVNSQLLKEQRNELVKEVADVPFTNHHKNVNFKIDRHIDVTESDIYEYGQMQNVLKYSKALQKALEQVLKTKPSELDRKKWVGRGIDSRNLYDRQQRIFTKKNIPKSTDLAVSILIDQSGSMSGRNIDEAIRMAVILEDFCREFEIPLSIAGHCWSGCVYYDVYKEFDSIDVKDRYRLMQIHPRGCNRDGAALQYCGEHLLKRPEEKKLLILISDGQPNADGYSGERAKEDLKAIKKNLKNRGVELFAAAIDQDKEYIKAIYGDGFLDMSDLKKLPKTMVRLIESFMNI